MHRSSADPGPGWLSLSGLVVAAVLISFLLGRTPWFHNAENYKSDLYQVLLSPFPEPADDIVIVGFDEATLAGFAYRSPIDRRFLAELIDHLGKQGPKAIGLDLLLDTPTEPDKDRQLITALRSTASPVFVASGTAEDGLTDAQVQTQEQFLEGIDRVSVLLARDNIDAVVRHFQIARRRSGVTDLNLAAALASIDPERAGDPIVRLAYQGRPSEKEIPFPVYPANAVQLLPGNWFAGKYVLIGSTVEAVDNYRTPYVAAWGDEDGSFPGVAIHAFALDQLLRGYEVHFAGPLSGAMIAALLSVFGLLLLRSPLRLSLRIGVIGLSVGLYGVSTGAIYAWSGLLLPVTGPIFACTTCSLVYAVALWRRDRREKAFIRGAWSQYVSPQVVEQLVADPRRLRLGGEERKVTYIFTDIAGFTSLAENLPPEKVGILLNAYLDGIFDLFRAHGGTIDKIIGDAVVGMFGAPVDDERQEQNAVALALDIDRYCAEFSAEQAAAGIAFGETRIGINTGPALVGNFGGTDFFDYTGLGDTINIAARLEGANKAFGTRISVSGATREKVADIPFRKIGAVVLVGKDIPVDVFEPAPELDGIHRTLYNEAYAEMERGSEIAIDKLQDILVRFPDDRLVERHLARIRGSGLVTARLELEGK